MWRSAMVAVFGLVFAVVPALAQRGGGHASGGHASYGGHSSGGHFSGMRSGSGMASHGFTAPRQSISGRSYSRQSFSRPSYSRPSFSRPSSARQPSFVQPSFVRPGSSRNRAGSSRSRSFDSRNCFGCGRYGYAYPWGYGGFFDPYWWWGSGSSYDDDAARETDQANQMNEQSLEQQQTREQGDQDIYAQSAPQQVEDAQPAPAEVIPPTVLVFRDQRKQEVQNYAIVGQTLWNFSAQRTQKIPLADLDLIATAKANEERGVDFRLPNAPEGQ